MGDTKREKDHQHALPPFSETSLYAQFYKRSVLRRKKAEGDRPPQHRPRTYPAGITTAEPALIGNRTAKTGGVQHSAVGHHKGRDVSPLGTVMIADPVEGAVVAKIAFPDALRSLPGIQAHHGSSSGFRKKSRVRKPRSRCFVLLQLPAVAARSPSTM